MGKSKFKIILNEEFGELVSSTTCDKYTNDRMVVTFDVHDFVKCESYLFENESSQIGQYY